MSYDDYVTQRLGTLLRFATVVTCDPHVAEDVVQEVLLRAYGRWDRIAAMDHPEAYLKRMVVNAFLTWRPRSGVTLASGRSFRLSASGSLLR